MSALAAIDRAIARHNTTPPLTVNHLADALELVHPDGGITLMREPMEGIVLSYHQLQTAGFTVSAGGVADGIKINYCIAGRLEVSLNDGRTLFMGPGELSVETSTAGTFAFPGALYRGIEVFLTRPSLDSPPHLFAACGADLRELVASLSGGAQHNWTRRVPDALLQPIRDLIPRHDAHATARLRLAIVQLLIALADEGTPAQPYDGRILTKHQVEIARAASALLTEDLGRRRTVADVAKELGVKPTSLKNYFQGVYGASISIYVLDRRMDRAAELLRKGTLPVADVAREVGYANAGKFCAAFKRRFGTTPLKYRHEANLPRPASLLESACGIPQRETGDPASTCGSCPLL